MLKNDFIESVKLGSPRARLLLSNTLSSDIAEVLSNAGNPSKISDRVSEGTETKKDSEKTGVHCHMFT